MNSPTTSVIYRCPHCHSADVYWDTTCFWDEETQSFQMTDEGPVYSHDAICYTCGREFPEADKVTTDNRVSQYTCPRCDNHEHLHIHATAAWNQKKRTWILLPQSIGPGTHTTCSHCEWEGTLYSTQHLPVSANDE